jgi:hypothetical protein
VQQHAKSRATTTFFCSSASALLFLGHEARKTHDFQLRVQRVPAETSEREAINERRVGKLYGQACGNGDEVDDVRGNPSSY